jgi:uncharacterized protein (DUF2141 family)
LNLLRYFILSVIVTVSVCGCANRVTPEGGDKDVKAPEIVKVQPPSGSVGLSKGEISITFNEYVQLKESSGRVIVSPVISPAPTFAIRKKSIIISLPDSLRPNTTYTINFGNTIADVNEGNSLPSYQYVFSTGTYLDSLMVKGRIVNAQTGKPEKDAVALLYQENTPDSMLLKKIPDYFALSGQDGNFTIYNIAPGKYHVLALSDKNKNYILDQADETAGFISEPLELKDSAKMTIRVSPQYPQKQSIKSAQITGPGKLVTVFARPVGEASTNFLLPKADNIITEYSVNRDTVTLYFKGARADSAIVVWNYNSLTDTIKYKRTREFLLQKNKELKLSYFIAPHSGENLTPETVPSIKWSEPISEFDSSKISILKDSVAYFYTVSFTDSIRTKMQFNADWAEGSYRINILPGAVKGWTGVINDTVRVAFIVSPSREKGSITFHFSTPKTEKLLLQLVNEKDELIRQRKVSGNINDIFERIDPGTYRLRYVEDINSNGKWDAGDYRLGIQPENIFYNAEPVIVRANWDVEINWNE